MSLTVTTVTSGPLHEEDVRIAAELIRGLVDDSALAAAVLQSLTSLRSTLETTATTSPAIIEASESQLASVEAGSADHKELVIVYAEALAESRADESRDAFLAFATEHPDMVEPVDYKYVVSGLRTHAAYLQAIDVMDAGKKRWAEDSTIDELVDALKQDIANSGDADSMAKMKGLGYM